MCKVPVSAITQTAARINSPDTWTDFQTAWAYYEANRPRLAGVGYVFSPDDPFVGIDLDNCRDRSTGHLAPWAEQIVHDLDSYAEISPSGTGLKIFLQSDERVPSRRRSSPDVEIYYSHRFFVVTGRQALSGQSCIENRTNELLQLHARLFPPTRDTISPASRKQSINEVAPDDQILRRAFVAKNGNKFQALWKGCLKQHDGNHSQADLGLCRILAFWTGPCPEQIDRIFRRSGLFRPKWDERHLSDGTTYGEMTIEKAIAAQGTKFYAWRSLQSGNSRARANSIPSTQRNPDMSNSQTSPKAETPRRNSSGNATSGNRIVHVAVSEKVFNHAKAQAFLSGVPWPSFVEQVLADSNPITLINREK